MAELVMAAPCKVSTTASNHFGARKGRTSELGFYVYLPAFIWAEIRAGLGCSMKSALGRFNAPDGQGGLVVRQSYAT